MMKAPSSSLVTTVAVFLLLLVATSQLTAIVVNANTLSTPLTPLVFLNDTDAINRTLTLRAPTFNQLNNLIKNSPKHWTYASFRDTIWSTNIELPLQFRITPVSNSYPSIVDSSSYVNFSIFVKRPTTVITNEASARMVRAGRFDEVCRDRFAASKGITDATSAEERASPPCPYVRVAPPLGSLIRNESSTSSSIELLNVTSSFASSIQRGFPFTGTCVPSDSSSSSSESDPPAHIASFSVPIPKTQKDSSVHLTRLLFPSYFLLGYFDSKTKAKSTSSSDGVMSPFLTCDRHSIPNLEFVINYKTPSSSQESVAVEFLNDRNSSSSSTSIHEIQPQILIPPSFVATDLFTQKTENIETQKQYSKLAANKFSSSGEGAFFALASTLGAKEDTQFYPVDVPYNTIPLGNDKTLRSNNAFRVLHVSPFAFLQNDSSTSESDIPMSTQTMYKSGGQIKNVPALGCLIDGSIYFEEEKDIVCNIPISSSLSGSASSLFGRLSFFLNEALDAKKFFGPENEGAIKVQLTSSSSLSSSKNTIPIECDTFKQASSSSSTSFAEISLTQRNCGNAIVCSTANYINLFSNDQNDSYYDNLEITFSPKNTTLSSSLFLASLSYAPKTATSSASSVVTYSSDGGTILTLPPTDRDVEDAIENPNDYYENECPYLFGASLEFFNYFPHATENQFTKEVEWMMKKRTVKADGKSSFENVNSQEECYNKNNNNNDLPSTFYCKTDRLCLNSSLLCDGIAHCSDGSDEDLAATCSMFSRKSWSLISPSSSSASEFFQVPSNVSSCNFNLTSSFSNVQSLIECQQISGSSIAAGGNDENNIQKNTSVIIYKSDSKTCNLFETLDSNSDCTGTSSTVENDPFFNFNYSLHVALIQRSNEHNQNIFNASVLCSGEWTSSSCDSSSAIIRTNISPLLALDNSFDSRPYFSNYVCSCVVSASSSSSSSGSSSVNSPFISASPSNGGGEGEQSIFIRITVDTSLSALDNTSSDAFKFYNDSELLTDEERSYISSSSSSNFSQNTAIGIALRGLYKQANQIYALHDVKNESSSPKIERDEKLVREEILSLFSSNSGSGLMKVAQIESSSSIILSVKTLAVFDLLGSALVDSRSERSRLVLSNRTTTKSAFLSNVEVLVVSSLTTLQLLNDDDFTGVFFSSQNSNNNNENPRLITSNSTHKTALLTSPVFSSTDNDQKLLLNSMTISFGITNSSDSDSLLGSQTSDYFSRIALTFAFFNQNQEIVNTSTSANLLLSDLLDNISKNCSYTLADEAVLDVASTPRANTSSLDFFGTLTCDLNLSSKEAIGFDLLTSSDVVGFHLLVVAPAESFVSESSQSTLAKDLFIVPEFLSRSSLPSISFSSSSSSSSSSVSSSSSSRRATSSSSSSSTNNNNNNKFFYEKFDEAINNPSEPMTVTFASSINELLPVLTYVGIGLTGLLSILTLVFYCLDRRDNRGEMDAPPELQSIDKEQMMLHDLEKEYRIMNGVQQQQQNQQPRQQENNSSSPSSPNHDNNNDGNDQNQNQNNNNVDDEPDPLMEFFNNTFSNRNVLSDDDIVFVQGEENNNNENENENENNNNNDLKNPNHPRNIFGASGAEAAMDEEGKAAQAISNEIHRQRQIVAMQNQKLQDHREHIEREQAIEGNFFMGVGLFKMPQMATWARATSRFANQYTYTKWYRRWDVAHHITGIFTILSFLITALVLFAWQVNVIPVETNYDVVVQIFDADLSGYDQPANIPSSENRPLPIGLFNFQGTGDCTEGYGFVHRDSRNSPEQLSEATRRVFGNFFAAKCQEHSGGNHPRVFPSSNPGADRGSGLKVSSSSVACSDTVDASPLTDTSTFYKLPASFSRIYFPGISQDNYVPPTLYANISCTTRTQASDLIRGFAYGIYNNSSSSSSTSSSTSNSNNNVLIDTTNKTRVFLQGSTVQVNLSSQIQYSSSSSLTAPSPINLLIYRAESPSSASSSSPVIFSTSTTDNAGSAKFLTIARDDPRVSGLSPFDLPPYRIVSQSESSFETSTSSSLRDDLGTSFQARALPYPSQADSAIGFFFAGLGNHRNVSTSTSSSGNALSPYRDALRFVDVGADGSKTEAANFGKHPTASVHFFIRLPATTVISEGHTSGFVYVLADDIVIQTSSAQNNNKYPILDWLRMTLETGDINLWKEVPFAVYSAVYVDTRKKIINFIYADAHQPATILTFNLALLGTDRLFTGSWHHVAFSISKEEQKIQLFVDGESSQTRPGWVRCAGVDIPSIPPHTERVSRAQEFQQILNKQEQTTTTFSKILSARYSSSSSSSSTTSFALSAQSSLIVGAFKGGLYNLEFKSTEIERDDILLSLGTRLSRRFDTYNQTAFFMVGFFCIFSAFAMLLLTIHHLIAGYINDAIREGELEEEAARIEYQNILGVQWPEQKLVTFDTNDNAVISMSPESAIVASGLSARVYGLVLQQLLSLAFNSDDAKSDLLAFLWAQAKNDLVIPVPSSVSPTMMSSPAPGSLAASVTNAENFDPNASYTSNPAQEEEWAELTRRGSFTNLDDLRKQARGYNIQVALSQLEYWKAANNAELTDDGVFKLPPILWHLLVESFDGQIDEKVEDLLKEESLQYRRLHENHQHPRFRDEFVRTTYTGAQAIARQQQQQQVKANNNNNNNSLQQQQNKQQQQSQQVTATSSTFAAAKAGAGGGTANANTSESLANTVVQMILPIFIVIQALDIYMLNFEFPDLYKGFFLRSTREASFDVEIWFNDLWKQHPLRLYFSGVVLSIFVAALLTYFVFYDHREWIKIVARYVQQRALLDGPLIHQAEVEKRKTRFVKKLMAKGLTERAALKSFQQFLKTPEGKSFVLSEDAIKHPHKKLQQQQNNNNKKTNQYPRENSNSRENSMETGDFYSMSPLTNTAEVSIPPEVLRFKHEENILSQIEALVPDNNDGSALSTPRWALKLLRFITPVRVNVSIDQLIDGGRRDPYIEVSPDELSPASIPKSIVPKILWKLLPDWNRSDKFEESFVSILSVPRIQDMVRYHQAVSNNNNNNNSQDETSIKKDENAKELEQIVNDLKTSMEVDGGAGEFASRMKKKPLLSKRRGLMSESHRHEHQNATAALLNRRNNKDNNNNNTNHHEHEAELPSSPHLEAHQSSSFSPFPLDRVTNRCPLHRDRVLGKIDRRITEKPPQCFIVSKGGERCCRHKTCEMFTCDQILEDGVSRCPYALCSFHTRMTLWQFLQGQVVSLWRSAVDLGVLGAIAIIIIAIAQLIYLPVTKACFQFLSCDVRFQCFIPRCWSDPDAKFLLAAALVVLVLFAVGVGVPLVISAALWRRWNILANCFYHHEFKKFYLEVDAEAQQELLRKRTREREKLNKTNRRRRKLLKRAKEISERMNRPDMDYMTVYRELERRAKTGKDKSGDPDLQDLSDEDDDGDDRTSYDPTKGWIFGLLNWLGLADTSHAKAMIDHARASEVATTWSVVSSKEWDRFLTSDTSLMFSLYRTLEFEWIMITPLLLLYRLVIVTPSILLEQGSVNQLVAIAAIEVLFGTFMHWAQPYVNSWVDSMYRFGSIHNVGIIGLVSFRRVIVSNLEVNWGSFDSFGVESSGIDVVMSFWTFGYYFFVAILLFMAVVLPTTQQIVGEIAVANELSLVGMRTLELSSLFLNPLLEFFSSDLGLTKDEKEKQQKELSEKRRRQNHNQLPPQLKERDTFQHHDVFGQNADELPPNPAEEEPKEEDNNNEEDKPVWHDPSSNNGLKIVGRKSFSVIEGGLGFSPERNVGNNNNNDSPNASPSESASPQRQQEQESNYSPREQDKNDESNNNDRNIKSLNATTDTMVQDKVRQAIEDATIRTAAQSEVGSPLASTENSTNHNDNTEKSKQPASSFYLSGQFSLIDSMKDPLKLSVNIDDVSASRQEEENQNNNNNEDSNKPSSSAAERDHHHHDDDEVINVDE